MVLVQKNNNPMVASQLIIIQRLSLQLDFLRHWHSKVPQKLVREGHQDFLSSKSFPVEILRQAVSNFDLPNSQPCSQYCVISGSPITCRSEATFSSSQYAAYTTKDRA